MKYQVTGGHPSVKTWHGREAFQWSVSPCFHYGLRIKFNTAISTHYAFFSRRRHRLFWWPKTKGGTPSWRSWLYQTSPLLSLETIWTVAWSNPCNSGFVLIIVSICDFQRVFRSLVLNSYVTWYTTSANRHRRFDSISSKRWTKHCR